VFDLTPVVLHRPLKDRMKHATSTEGYFFSERVDSGGEKIYKG